MRRYTSGIEAFAVASRAPRYGTIGYVGGDGAESVYVMGGLPSSAALDGPSNSTDPGYLCATEADQLLVATPALLGVANLLWLSTVDCAGAIVVRRGQDFGGWSFGGAVSPDPFGDTTDPPTNILVGLFQSNGIAIEGLHVPLSDRSAPTADAEGAQAEARSLCERLIDRIAVDFANRRFGGRALALSPSAWSPGPSRQRSTPTYPESLSAKELPTLQDLGRLVWAHLDGPEDVLEREDRWRTFLASQAIVATTADESNNWEATCSALATLTECARSTTAQERISAGLPRSVSSQREQERLSRQLSSLLTGLGFAEGLAREVTWVELLRDCVLLGLLEDPLVGLVMSALRAVKLGTKPDDVQFAAMVDLLGLDPDSSWAMAASFWMMDTVRDLDDDRLHRALQAHLVAIARSTPGPDLSEQEGSPSKDGSAELAEFAYIRDLQRDLRLDVPLRYALVAQILYAEALGRGPPGDALMPSLLMAPHLGEASGAEEPAPGLSLDQRCQLARFLPVVFARAGEWSLDAVAYLGTFWVAVSPRLNAAGGGLTVEDQQQIFERLAMQEHAGRARFGSSAAVDAVRSLTALATAWLPPPPRLLSIEEAEYQYHDIPVRSTVVGASMTFADMALREDCERAATEAPTSDDPRVHLHFAGVAMAAFVDARDPGFRSTADYDEILAVRSRALDSEAVKDVYARCLGDQLRTHLGGEDAADAALAEAMGWLSNPIVHHAPQYIGNGSQGEPCVRATAWLGVTLPLLTRFLIAGVALGPHERSEECAAAVRAFLGEVLLCTGVNGAVPPPTDRWAAALEGSSVSAPGTGGPVSVAVLMDRLSKFTKVPVNLGQSFPKGSFLERHAKDWKPYSDSLDDLAILLKVASPLLENIQGVSGGGFQDGGTDLVSYSKFALRIVERGLLFAWGLEPAGAVLTPILSKGAGSEIWKTLTTTDPTDVPVPWGLRGVTAPRLLAIGTIRALGVGLDGVANLLNAVKALEGTEADSSRGSALFGFCNGLFFVAFGTVGVTQVVVGGAMMMELLLVGSTSLGAVLPPLAAASAVVGASFLLYQVWRAQYQEIVFSDACGRLGFYRQQPTSELWQEDLRGVRLTRLGQTDYFLDRGTDKVVRVVDLRLGAPGGFLLLGLVGDSLPPEEASFRLDPVNAMDLAAEVDGLLVPMEQLQPASGSSPKRADGSPPTVAAGAGLAQVVVDQTHTLTITAPVAARIVTLFHPDWPMEGGRYRVRKNDPVVTLLFYRPPAS